MWGAGVGAEELSPFLCSVMANTEEKVSKGRPARGEKRIPFSSECTFVWLQSHFKPGGAFKVSYVRLINACSRDVKE